MRVRQVQGNGMTAEQTNCECCERYADRGICEDCGTWLVDNPWKGCGLAELESWKWVEENAIRLRHEKIEELNRGNADAAFRLTKMREAIEYAKEHGIE